MFYASLPVIFSHFTRQHATLARFFHTQGVGSNDDAVINSLARSSKVFSHFTTYEFVTAQRSAGDAAYDNWLGQLSVNRAPGPVVVHEDELPPTLRKVYIPPQCFKTDDVEAALGFLYGVPPPPEGPFPALNPRYALLTTLNKTVDAVNDIVLDKYVGGEAMELEAAHEVKKDASGNDARDPIARQHSTIEYLRTVRESGLPPSTLRLKKGCVLILMRNMLSSLGLVNGTRLLLLSDPPPAGDHLSVLHVETVSYSVPTGPGQAPCRHFIPRISFEMKTPGGLMVRRPRG